MDLPPTSRDFSASDTSTTQDSTVTWSGLASSPRAKALHMAAMKAQGKSQHTRLAGRLTHMTDFRGDGRLVGGASGPGLVPAVALNCALVASRQGGASGTGELGGADRGGHRRWGCGGWRGCDFAHPDADRCGSECAAPGFVGAAVALVALIEAEQREAVRRRELVIAGEHLRGLIAAAAAAGVEVSLI